MLAWLSVWRLVLPFWYRFTRVVPEKGPLNGCVCVTVRVNKMHTQRTHFLPKLLSLWFVILSTSAHYRPFSAMKSQTTVKCINDIKHKHMQPFNGPLSGTTQVSWYQTKKKKDLHSQQGHPLYCALSQRGLLDQIKQAYNQSQPDGRLKRTASALSNYGSVRRQSWSQCNIKISKKKT